MESANTSLNNLSDIILPPPILFWPLGQGAYLLLIAILITAAFLTYTCLARYKSNYYRRMGLSLLDSATTVYDVSVALKRVALAAFPRERVASLYGDLWVGFLQDTCSDCDFGQLLSQPNDDAEITLITIARYWVRNHNVSHRE